MASGPGNYFDAEGLYNDCLAFMPEIEAVLAKLEASLYELVQVSVFLVSAFSANDGEFLDPKSISEKGYYFETIL